RRASSRRRGGACVSVRFCRTPATPPSGTLSLDDALPISFDEYREETLRRLEEEQREFRDFLARLRMAKDKAEFDQFMADRASAGDRKEHTSELQSLTSLVCPLLLHKTTRLTPLPPTAPHH